MRQTMSGSRLQLCRAFSLLFLPVFYCSYAIGQTDTAANRQVITRFFEKQARVRYVYQTTLNSDGGFVAWSADSDHGPRIQYASTKAPSKPLTVSACAAGEEATETEPQWSPDGREIAFLSDAKNRNQQQLYVIPILKGNVLAQRAITSFDGYVSHLRWSPDGRYLSVLYVEKATREPSPMAADNKAVGLIDSLVNKDIQRIAVIDRKTGEMRQITPLRKYIYEYDWSPDSKSFTYTAASPPGDDNWYVAGLFVQSIASGQPVPVYTPRFQIALPRWSPDGKTIAFIEGIMSDQGGTGGEIFVVPATGDRAPANLTPDRSSTPSWFCWTPKGNMIFSEFVGGSVAVNELTTATRSIRQMFHADASIRAGNEEMSLSAAMRGTAITFAFIRSSWTSYPEVWTGTPDKQRQLTALNTVLQQPDLRPVNITWYNKSQRVQGWLLPPANYDSTRTYPMLVCVHGGPAWITTPTWSAPDFNSTVYPKLGYFVFFPNPRGSYGQGEKFTLANRRDWGFGDLQDILSGVDTIVSRYPVDSTRIGIYGWSYGGASSMFAVTQTNKFKAAVAGAGAADWLSYYGQNSIDKWMKSYFGASPYDDPEAYRKCSAMTYLKNARTPTLVLVGERDGEAPPPQSLQFWHALKELNVPTQLMIYADEGHSFGKFENMIDVSVRTIEWFNTHLK